MNKKNSSIVISLQILLSFILGIFGNKASELISIKPIYLIVIVIILLIASFLLSLPKEVFKIDKNKFKNFIYNNNIVIFPLFFSFGVISSMIIIKTFNILSITASFGFTYYYNEISGIETYTYLYEVICYLILTLLVWYYRKQNPNLLSLFISVIGSASGVATSILYFKPTENTPFLTFFGGLVICLIILSIIDFLFTFKLERKSSR